MITLDVSYEPFAVRRCISQLWTQARWPMWITDTAKDAKESPGPPKISAAGFNSLLLSRVIFPSGRRIRKAFETSSQIWPPMWLWSHSIRLVCADWWISSPERPQWSLEVWCPPMPPGPDSTCCTSLLGSAGATTGSSHENWGLNCHWDGPIFFLQ